MNRMQMQNMERVFTRYRGYSRLMEVGELNLKRSSDTSASVYRCMGVDRRHQCLREVHVVIMPRSDTLLSNYVPALKDTLPQESHIIVVCKAFFSPQVRKHLADHFAEWECMLYSDFNCVLPEHVYVSRLEIVPPEVPLPPGMSRDKLSKIVARQDAHARVLGLLPGEVVREVGSAVDAGPTTQYLQVVSSEA